MKMCSNDCTIRKWPQPRILPTEFVVRGSVAHLKVHKIEIGPALVSWQDVSLEVR